MASVTVTSRSRRLAVLLTLKIYSDLTSACPLSRNADAAQNRTLGHGHLLAVGGEEGNVTIAATDDIAALKRGTTDGSWRPRAHLPCHRNSIFDLAWAKVGRRVLIRKIV